MTFKQTLPAAVLASGLAIASAFSVGPSSMASHLSSSSMSTNLPLRTGMALSVAAEVDVETTTTSTKQQQPQQHDRIDLLDEVDSIFDCIDTNGDGEISPDELRAHLVDDMGYSQKYTNYLFDSIDTDSNGSISLEELRFAFYNFEALSMYMTFGMGGADMTQRPAFKKLALKSAHQYYDMENDDDDEQQRTHDKLLLDDLADLIFDIIDTDKSGAISTKELTAHFDQVTQKLAKTAKDQATQKQAQEYVDTMFATLDVDKNGEIERAEIRAAFDKYDFKLLARTFGLKVYRSL